MRHSLILINSKTALNRAKKGLVFSQCVDKDKHKELHKITMQ